jgi:hypothetical protein
MDDASYRQASAQALAFLLGEPAVPAKQEEAKKKQQPKEQKKKEAPPPPASPPEPSRRKKKGDPNFHAHKTEAPDAGGNLQQIKGSILGKRKAGPPQKQVENAMVQVMFEIKQRELGGPTVKRRKTEVCLHYLLQLVHSRFCSASRRRTRRTRR